MTAPQQEEQSTAWPPPHWAPPFTILMTTLVTVFMGVLIGGALTMAMGKIWGFDLMEVMTSIAVENTPEKRNMLRGSNLVSHLMAFSGASIAAAVLVFRRQWIVQLGLSHLAGWKKITAAIGFMLFAMPWVQLTYWLNKQVPMPSWMTSMEQRTGDIIQSILVMDTPGELFFTLVVIALAPAVGEELLFRGIVQQQLGRWLGKPAAAIWITAILFSIIHFQFAGFLPRLLLGAGLGYLFFWTRSLWAPIAGHFAINAIQVIIQYFAKMDLDSAEAQLNFSTMVIPCLLVLPVLFWLVRALRPEEQAQTTYIT